MTVTEFVLARIAEDWETAYGGAPSPWTSQDRTVRDRHGEVTATCYYGGTLGHVLQFDPTRILRELEVMRRIVELHRDWPVLVEEPARLERVDFGEPSQFTMRLSQQIAWMTEAEYRKRFGEEPPTAPIIRELAAIWSEHPDYDQNWRP